MNKSLFQITDEQSKLLQFIDENDGEFTPEIEEALVISQQELATKSQNYIYVLKRLEAEKEMAKEVEAQAKAFRAKKEKAIARLENALLDATLRFGKIESGIHTVSTRKSESVVITDHWKIPAEYTTPKLEVVPNKNMIKAAIKSGKEVPGAELVVKDNLSIK